MQQVSTVDNAMSYDVLLLDRTGTDIHIHMKRDEARIRKENTQENTQIFAICQRERLLTLLRPQSRFGNN